MRDHADNVVVVCSIENFDPMGVHTGDSITVAPAQTLTDVEYQRIRDAAFACIRRIGVDTGGSNIQFAVNPADGRHADHRDEPARVAIERAREQGDGVPDRQDRRPARRRVPARRGHERHHRRDPGVVRAHHRLRRHQDPAVGVREAARRDGDARDDDAIGRRGDGHRPHVPRVAPEGDPLVGDRTLRPELRPGRGRRWRSRAPTSSCAPPRFRPPTGLFALEARAPAGRARRPAGRRRPASTPGSSTGSSRSSRSAPVSPPSRSAARPAETGAGRSGSGFSDAQLAYLWDSDEDTVRAARLEAGVRVTYKTVDTCAAEFAARTPYHYGTFEDEDEVAAARRSRRS